MMRFSLLIGGINHIYINVLSWNIIKKIKHLATWGLEPVEPVSVNRHAIYSRPSCIPENLRILRELEVINLGHEQDCKKRVIKPKHARSQTLINYYFF